MPPGNRFCAVGRRAIQTPISRLGGGLPRIGGHAEVASAELPFEYMLNALRLIDGVPAGDFIARTGLPLDRIAAQVADGQRRGWLESDPEHLATTALGQRFLNDVIASFLA